MICSTPLQVTNLLAIELAYVNTKHPDFTEASLIHRTMTEPPVDSMAAMQLKKPAEPQLKVRQGILNCLCLHYMACAKIVFKKCQHSITELRLVWSKCSDFERGGVSGGHYQSAPLTSRGMRSQL